MPHETFLSSQLRESVPYLAEAGFKQTAALMLAAADELEMLQELVKQHVPDIDIEQHRANENEKLRRTG